ncbi:MAG: hypothetical protein WBA12_12795, partial [Catalinimonas sp.]
RILRQVLKSVILVGLFGAPLLALLPRLNLSRRRHFVLIAVNLGVLALTWWAGKAFPFGGNYVYNLGLGPPLLSDVYRFGLSAPGALPGWVLLVVQLGGQLGGSYLLLHLWRRFRAGADGFAWFLLLLLVAYFVLMSVVTFFDRYLLLPGCIVFLLLAPCVRVPAARWRGALYAAGVLLLGWYSVTGTHAYLNWNRTRLALYEALRAEGIPTEQVDGGHELNAWYADLDTPREDKWWFVPDGRYVITFQPVPGYAIYRRMTYGDYLQPGEQALYVLRRQAE